MEIKTKTPWEEKFTWFWFSDEQIFEWTQEDFDRAAKELYDCGITMAINFTLTHFRMGFIKYWDRIHNAFKMFCDAAHKYNIKVIEHNSSSLSHDLLRSAGWKRFEDDINSYTNFKSSVEKWIEVPRFLLNDPEVYGKKLDTLFQVDGRTGKRANSIYDLNIFCYNNPDYREMYFKYRTEELKIVPFDGIMDDDVQWFADGHACACEHCRKLFKEQYGYDLPYPDKWNEFYGDYNNPAFVAWIRFKKESTERFYRDLTKLYESIGRGDIGRPNYQSDILKWNPTFSGFDSCMDQWTFIFQENCFSAVMKNSYPDFMVEAVHRFAAAEKNGVPSMSMFYPDREDSTYFSWALSRTWGQLYCGTSEGVDITAIEKKYRDFESANILAYSSPKKVEDLAFYYSMQTRDFAAPQYEMAEKYSLPYLGAMQASCHALLGTNMAFESDSVEELLEHKVLAVAFMAMVNETELNKFKEYVNRGGKLIAYGDFATVDATNAKRNVNKLLSYFGIDATAEEFDAVSDMTVNYNGKSVNICEMRAQLAFSGAESVAELAGKTVGIRANLGDGEFIWVAAKPEVSEYQKTIWVNRRVANPAPEETQPDLRAHQAAHSGALLDIFVGERMYDIECENRDLLVGAYNTEAGLAINISNIKGAISDKAEMITHADLIPSFVADAPKMPELKVSIKCDGATKATLKSPELADDVKIAAIYADGKASFTIPAGTFASYALILLEE